jgi:shikimate kinase
LSDFNRIFFVGPMGVGKTTIGQRLAQLLDYEFIDTDETIERKTGVKIDRIFEIEGENGFRKREEAVIEEISRHDKIIVATGGGVILSQRNRNVLSQRGLVLYLTSQLDTLLERLKADKSRPLLQVENPQAKLAEIVLERDSLYRDIADYVIPTDTQPIHQIIQTISKYIHVIEN